MELHLPPEAQAPSIHLSRDTRYCILIKRAAALCESHRNFLSKGEKLKGRGGGTAFEPRLFSILAPPPPKINRHKVSELGGEVDS